MAFVASQAYIYYRIDEQFLDGQRGESNTTRGRNKKLNNEPKTLPVSAKPPARDTLLLISKRHYYVDKDKDMDMDMLGLAAP